MGKNIEHVSLSKFLRNEKEKGKSCSSSELQRKPLRETQCHTNYRDKNRRWHSFVGHEWMNAIKIKDSSVNSPKVLFWSLEEFHFMATSKVKNILITIEILLSIFKETVKWHVINSWMDTYGLGHQVPNQTSIDKSKTFI
jgi:hypothetical protein